MDKKLSFKYIIFKKVYIKILKAMKIMVLRIYL